MALPAQIVALYCLKFGLNAAIHTIIFLGTSDSYKRHTPFLLCFQLLCKGRNQKLFNQCTLFTCKTTLHDLWGQKGKAGLNLQC